MIVLEYLLKDERISNISLAKELNIATQNITIWITGRRKIPKKYFPLLSKKFGIPERFFNLELNDVIKSQLEAFRLSNEIGLERIKVNGEVEVVHSGCPELLELQELNTSLMKSFELIKNRLNDVEDCKDFLEIIKKQREHDRTAKFLSQVVKSIDLKKLDKILFSLLVAMDKKEDLGFDESITKFVNFFKDNLKNI